MNINFLDRERLEKANLEQKLFFGGFFELHFLRHLRVETLRSKATKLTNFPQSHQDNGDEKDFQNLSFVGSFTKGLPHDDTGKILDPEQFKRFRVAIHTGDFFNKQKPDLGRADCKWRAITIPEGNTNIRGWESPSSGLTFEIHGPDSHSVTMPPAPKLGTDELTFEMAEVYWLALLRDVPFRQFQEGAIVHETIPDNIQDAVNHLNALPWFKKGMPTAPNLEQRKRRVNKKNLLDAQTVFRGATDGDLIGPYLSQFLLIGSPAPNVGANRTNNDNICEGLISYGPLKIDQQFIPAQRELDHMTTWDVFLDVQDAANIRGTDQFESTKRFITYPRDLATYVHFDALYQAYLNAALILLGFKAPVDSGISQLNDIFSKRAQKASKDEFGRVDGFALFGGPHILNLVTEVATRALKAVRYQKFNIHCRLRPEALGGWMEAIKRDTDIKEIDQLMTMYDCLNQTLGGVNLFDELKAHNKKQNTQEKFCERPYVNQPVNCLGEETLLLPMAFPEGSPMHPAYGAGHATVAGACVTIVKAFFDTSAVFVCDSKGDIKIISQKQYKENSKDYKPVAFIPNSNGTKLENMYDGHCNLPDKPLTVGDELNKLAANISIGRNMAGVHYYTDYIDSLVMGEKIALGILLEQSLAYEIYPKAVRPSFSLTTFLNNRQFTIQDGKIIENGQQVNWHQL